MKKYISLFLILILTFLLSGCTKKEKELNDLELIKERGYIIVGVKYDSPPFGYYKNNHLHGIDIDIARAIAQNIFEDFTEGNIQFVEVNTQNRISKLNAREVDILVATMSVNEKRKLIMDFSIPYFMAGQKILVRKNSPVKNLQYFNKNGKLAVVMGSIAEKAVRNTSPNANITGTKSFPEAVKLLKEKKIDGVLGDDCILNSLNDGSFTLINRNYSREYYAVATRKGDNSKELLNKINTAIADYLDKNKLKK